MCALSPLSCFIRGSAIMMYMVRIIPDYSAEVDIPPVLRWSRAPANLINHFTDLTCRSSRYRAGRRAFPDLGVLGEYPFFVLFLFAIYRFM